MENKYFYHPLESDIRKHYLRLFFYINNDLYGIVEGYSFKCKGPTWDETNWSLLRPATTEEMRSISEIRIELEKYQFYKDILS